MDPVVCTASDQCHAAGTCDPATGTCSNPARPDGAPCDDGNGCTQTDTCQGAICVGSQPVVCTALDQCHIAGTCDPATGTCSNPARPDGAPCDDGNGCTQTDTCQGAICVGSQPVVCTALDQCHTAATCDPATGTCSNPTRHDGTSCDDGDGCTVGDRCLGGRCTGVPRSCDDGVPCTDDSCVAGECRHEPLDGRCDTGECFLAQCTPGAPGADAAGCTRAPVGEGDTCTSDDFACTEDVCTAGACRHMPIDSRCATGEACLPAVCDPAGPGADPAGCVAVPERVNGLVCAEDGDPCTDDTCMAGACAHAPVSNKPACDPIRPAYERALALAAAARDLSALVTGALSAAAASTSGSPGDSLAASVADVASTLEGVARILAGKAQALVGAVPLAAGPGGTSPAGLQNILKERAQMALEQLRRTPAAEQSVIHGIVLAQHRAELTPDTGHDLRHRGRDLLRGTKAFKRSLRRLKRVSQSFTR